MIADSFMKLALEPLPVKQIRSHYRDGEPGFPSRMGFMHPLCVEAFCEMQEAAGWNIVLTDAWRAGAASLKRKYPKGKSPRRGVQFPAYSAHNYGFAIDISVRQTMKRMKMSKKELDEFMAQFGFFCHRTDHRLTHEAWHYNCLVLGGDPGLWLKFAGRRTSKAVEKMIEACYGLFWSPSDSQKQRYLQFLGLYDGEIDGKFGRKSKAAAKKFQRQWRLKADGVIGPKTARVLAFRCAELQNPHTKDLWTVRL